MMKLITEIGATTTAVIEMLLDILSIETEIKPSWETKCLCYILFCAEVHQTFRVSAVWMNVAKKKEQGMYLTKKSKR